MNFIGIDIGGTKIEAVLLSDKFDVLVKKRILTNKENYAKFLNQICNLVFEFEENEKFRIGIGIPGTISDLGVVNHSNIKNLIGKNLKKDLYGLLDRNLVIENDANCFALAEAVMGSGKNSSIVLGVIIGTGVGAGIVIDKKIFHGKNNFAGEWGHHSIYPMGKDCYCGRKGCVDQYISGVSLEKRWFELTGEKLTVKEILNNHMDSHFSVWKNEFISNFGSGVANLISIVDPDIIVLGGGLSNIDFIYEEGIKCVTNNLPKHFAPTPIVQNYLGDSSGSLGSALLAAYYYHTNF